MKTEPIEVLERYGISKTLTLLYWRNGDFRLDRYKHNDENIRYRINEEAKKHLVCKYGKVNQKELCS